MQQFYKAVMKDENGQMIHFEASNYFAGKGLLEHSLFGNFFVNSIMKEIFENKKEIIWIGDYVTSKDLPQNFKNYKTKIKSSNSKTQIKDKTFFENFKFVFNHTKKQYIEFEKYKKDVCNFLLAKIKDSFQRDYFLENIIHPLPILLAIKNNLEISQDYSYEKDFPFSEKVGYWAGDEIEVCQNFKYPSYEQLKIIFINKSFKEAN